MKKFLLFFTILNIFLFDKTSLSNETHEITFYSYDKYFHESLKTKFEDLKCPSFLICERVKKIKFKSNDYYAIKAKGVSKYVDNVHIIFKILSDHSVRMEVYESFSEKNFNIDKQRFHWGNFEGRREYERVLSGLLSDGEFDLETTVKIVEKSGVLFHKKREQETDGTLIYFKPPAPPSTFCAETGCNLLPESLWFLHINYSGNVIEEVSTLPFLPSEGHDQNLLRKQIKSYISRIDDEGDNVWPKFESKRDLQ